MDPDGTFEVGSICTDFGVKAFFAKSRYSFIHSSIVIRSLPSIIAMILCDVSQSAWYYFDVEKEPTLPSDACAPNQVNVVAYMAQTVFVADLFHDIFKNEETGETPNATTISSRVSETK